MTGSLVNLSGGLAIGTGIGLIVALSDAFAGWLVILAGCAAICGVALHGVWRERRDSYADRDRSGRRLK